jgi:hypothetical protein
MANEIATMPIVAELLSLTSKRAGSSRKYPCPKCGKMAFEANDIKGHCFKCGFGGNYITYYAVACGISTKEATKRIAASTGGTTTFTYTPTEEPEEPIADISVRDKAYRTLLSNLSLSKKHIADLKARGLDEDTIKNLGYKSFYLGPQKARVEITEKIINSGASIDGVPGFYLNQDTKSGFYGKYILCWRKQGILVPYIDCEGNVQGFQVRKDNEKLEKDEDGKLENKYDWISSKGKKKGCGSRAYVHFACDFYGDFKTKKKQPVLAKEMIITEGAMKADIAHALTGLPIIAVPGVETLLELDSVLDYLKANGVEEIMNGFDMDYMTNPNVQRAQEKLEAMVNSKGLKYSRLVWDENYKGIDDYTYARKLKKQPLEIAKK